MKIRDAAPIAAAIVLAGALGTGIVALIASGEPAPTAQPAPSAVVTTADAPGTDRLAPRCFETSTAGAQDCAWIPVAPCLTDESGDDAIPSSYDGCYWDAGTRGNREGSSYVIWRGGRG